MKERQICFRISYKRLCESWLPRTGHRGVSLGFQKYATWWILRQYVFKRQDGSNFI